MQFGKCCAWAWGYPVLVSGGAADSDGALEEAIPGGKGISPEDEVGAKVWSQKIVSHIHALVALGWRGLDGRPPSSFPPPLPLLSQHCGRVVHSLIRSQDSEINS